MKTYKKNEHSVLITPFGVGGRLYLSITTMIFFDLTSPESPLKEQELWGVIPGELPKGHVLDQGLPKPKREVLVTGACCAPRGEVWPGSDVSFRVGDVQKRLLVFGDRYWRVTGYGVNTVTAPNSFSQMPINYENAFGGSGFDFNPLGKGLKPTKYLGVTPLVPLPNIEDVQHLVATPEDRPQPAGFGPWDMMWPQRSKKNGTYDDKWLQDHWPFFPTDMNYEFFNTAPEDQQAEGFFRGDERVEILHMHPDYQTLTSRLPGLRVRCFVTQKSTLKQAASTEAVFKEITTRIDTVWLFPGILRGVVMYRGYTKILDDEYSDVTHLFVASENLSEPPKPIEFFAEEQRKARDLKVPIDLSPLADARGKINRALQKVRLIPQQLNDAKQRALGQAPRLGITPEEALAAGPKIIQDQLNMLTALETRLQALKTRLSPFSHLVKVDYGFIADIKAKLLAASGKFDAAGGKLADMRQSMAAWQKNIKDMLSSKFSPNQLKDLGLDVDFPAPEKVNPWHDKYFPLAVKWRKNLEQNHNVQNDLITLGFQGSTLRRAWMGVNEELLADPTVEGLPPQVDGTGTPKPMEIPAGLVFPGFDGPVLNRLLIRAGDPLDPAGDILVQGSADKPLALILDDFAPAVIVRDELEAHFLWQEAGDFFSIYSLKDPGTTPQDEAAKSLKTTQAIMIILPAGTAKGTAMSERWREKYPAAIILPLPKGENLFEAHKAGVDLRAWLIEALPPEFKVGVQDGLALKLPPEGEAPGKDSAPRLTVPPLDVKGLVDGFIKDINGFLDAKMAPLKAMQKEVEGKALQKIITAGKNPGMFSEAAQNPPTLSAGEASQAGLAKIAKERAKLQAAGLLTPELDRQFAEASGKIKEIGAQGDALMKDGQAKLEAARKTCADIKAKAKSGELPTEVKDRLMAAGIDPDKMKRLTREEVAARYARGESLAGTNLSGLDLSELDMPGLDLREANCQKTIFAGSNLNDADLTQVIGNHADFSGCSLKRAKLDKAILIKALFRKTDLGQAGLIQTLLNKADLTAADLTGAKFRMSILQKATLTGAVFSKSEADMSIFSGVDASDAVFTGARLGKCYLKEALLDRADFSGASLNSTMLWEVKGEDVNFSGADMDKSRMGGQSSLPGADFAQASLRQACFRESNLSGANFKDGIIEEALIESCDLTDANFLLVPMKKSRLTKCDLEGADMRAVNLFQGSLRKSRLTNTDLRGSNLYGVDFYKTVVGDKTDFEQANLKMTHLHQRTDLLK